jgi:protein SCO1
VRRALAAAACAALVLAAGCDRIASSNRTPFKGIDITEPREEGTASSGKRKPSLGSELRLTDQNGRERTLADFRGKVVFIVFGFTQCPDVCPTALANAASAVRQMGEDGKQVQVLFVTVDPKRDTPEVLGQYVTAFDPRFLGLGGDAERVLKTARDFGMHVAQRPGSTPDTYTVDHSTQMFAFDREGRARLLIPHGTPPAAIASDLKILLN